MSDSVLRIEETLLPAEEGYNLASAWYDNWHWTKFWRRNELPLTTALLDCLPAGDALDAGSGTGLYRFALEARGHRTVAIDISRKMLEVQAGKRVGEKQRSDQKLVHGDIQSMPLLWSEAFDYIFCARVLSHINDHQLVFRELSRVLRKGGRLVLSDVDPSHPYTHVTIKNGIIYSRIRVFKHSHSNLRLALEASGLQIIAFRQLGLGDLFWRPTRTEFPQIHSAPEAAIFYIYELYKR